MPTESINVTDHQPTYDRCPACGHEGRVVTVENIRGMVGSGHRALPLRDLELEIASHVGAVTLAAGQLDAVMSSLVGGIPTGTGAAVEKTWGHSGKDLTNQLRVLAAGDPLDADWRRDVISLCDRYDAIYLVRNDVIHSFRPGTGIEQLDVVRAPKSTRANPFDAKRAFDVKRMGLPELVDLYYDITETTHDARNLFFRMVGLIR